MLPNVPNIICLFDGIEMASDLFDAATCRADDVVIASKVLNKEVLGSCGIGLIPAVRHRLSAASLVEREMHIEPNLSRSCRVAIPTSGKIMSI